MVAGGHEERMGPNMHGSGHPVDALVELAHGAAADAQGVERHLAECESCRLELEIVRALSADTPAPLTDIERRMAYRSFEARRRRARPARASGLAAAWRVAAAIAVLLTSVGVWRAVDGGPRATEWDPDAALEGFAEDLAALDVSDREVSAVLGAGLLGDPGVAWLERDDAGSDETDVPWEEER